MNLLTPLFSKDDLAAITQAIGNAERTTAGEIRVEIRQRRSRKEKGRSVEQIAREEFVRLGMTATRDRTGVLLFLLIEDREFCIFADEGIHGKVSQDTWTGIAEVLGGRFARRQFRDGVIDAVNAVGEVLRHHVPRRPDDRNELPNTVEVR